MYAKNQNSCTDEQLVRLLQQGDYNAMGSLYERYYMLVFSKCLSFMKNKEDADDHAQDIMLKVMEKIGLFKGESKFSTWLYAITFNHCTDKLRKMKGKYYTTIDAQVEFIDFSEMQQEEQVGIENKSEYARAAMLTISQEDKQLLEMKYQQNKSIQDLQDMYKLSASAVKMRLLRARAKAASLYYALAGSVAA